MRTSYHSPHIELIIAPSDLFPNERDDTFTPAVWDSAATARPAMITSGVYRIAVRGIPDAVEEHRSLPLHLLEGHWPEALGLRLLVEKGQWSIESDHYAIRPVYYGFDGQKRIVVSTRPDVVAALIHTGVSHQAVAELMLVGFNVDSHTIFEGVRRVRGGEHIVHNHSAAATMISRPELGPLEVGPEHWADQTWLTQLSDKVAKSFSDGDAIELTGGMDSRLVLAMARHGGQLPPLAFTIGKETDSDVVIAKQLCKLTGMRHLLLSMELDDDVIEGDARTFALRAGFAVDIGTYGRLPRAFRQLEMLRTGQVNGAGGRTGFYYTPLDAACRLRRVAGEWVKRCLIRSGAIHQTAELLGGERAAHAIADVTKGLLDLMDEAQGGTWRERTDAFYLRHRMRQWAGSALAASAYWYRPYAPLLDRGFVRWAQSAPHGLRPEKKQQMQLTFRLDPELGRLQYSGGKRMPAGPFDAAVVAAKRTFLVAERVRRRLVGTPGLAGMGAGQVITALADKPSVREAIWGLTEREGLGLDEAVVHRLLADPGRHLSELGFMIPVVWAMQSVRKLQGALGPTAVAGGIQ